MARTKVVDDEESSCSLANFTEHALAQIEVSEGPRFGDLEIDGMRVQRHGIVGSHEPTRAKLVRVHVDEERTRIPTLESNVSNDASEMTARLLRRCTAKQRGGIRKHRVPTTHQCFVRKDSASRRFDDRLVNDIEIFGAERTEIRGTVRQQRREIAVVRPDETIPIQRGRLPSIKLLRAPETTPIKKVAFRNIAYANRSGGDRVRW